MSAAMKALDDSLWNKEDTEHVQWVSLTEDYYTAIYAALRQQSVDSEEDCARVVRHQGRDSDKTSCQ